MHRFSYQSDTLTVFCLLPAVCCVVPPYCLGLLFCFVYPVGPVFTTSAVAFAPCLVFLILTSTAKLSLAARLERLSHTQQRTAATASFQSCFPNCSRRPARTFPRNSQHWNAKSFPLEHRNVPAKLPIVSFVPAQNGQKPRPSLDPGWSPQKRRQFWPGLAGMHPTFPALPIAIPPSTEPTNPKTALKH